MQARNTTVLTGGLGNQLFQIAYGIFKSEDNAIFVSQNLGNPRKNDDGLPEVFSYNLNLITDDSESERGIYGDKIFNLALRFSANASKLPAKPFLIPIMEVLCSGMTFLSTRKWKTFYISQGIGYDSRTKNQASVLVGYFQTYRWLENSTVHQTLQNMDVRHVGSDLMHLQELATSIKPLVVHFRFGDYKNESDFGIPDSNYYEKAFRFHFENYSYSEIWIFSDEMNLAIEKIPREYIDRVRLISDVDGSSAASLEAMRLGFGYVIANSTFSWWAAMLSKNAGAPVVAPKKWFKNAEDPVELIPRNWTLIDPWP